MVIFPLISYFIFTDTANIWEHKVGNDANIANLVCL